MAVHGNNGNSKEYRLAKQEPALTEEVAGAFMMMQSHARTHTHTHTKGILQTWIHADRLENKVAGVEHDHSHHNQKQNAAHKPCLHTLKHTGYKLHMKMQNKQTPNNNNW